MKERIKREEAAVGPEEEERTIVENIEDTKMIDREEMTGEKIVEMKKGLRTIIE